MSSSAFSGEGPEPTPAVIPGGWSSATPTLPTRFTTFVGRERETAEALNLLDRPSVRLLTLTGPGGVGKTRLALRVAEAAKPAFPDGVVFAALAPIRDPALVLPAIGQALDPREGGQLATIDQVAHALRERRRLLVLDNFEQVLDAASTVGDLLAACPELHAIVTSRVPLHLSTEQELPVPPFSPPPFGDPTGLAGLASNEAVALFLHRAGAVVPSFVLTESNAEPIAAICRRLDGLPLAIELAAARCKMLAPNALLARLDHSLQLLTGGPRDQPGRLQSVRDTVAWSYDLLGPDEQRLFRTLGVFAGGFTLEAAEAVAPGEAHSVFDGIASLVNKSLLTTQPTAGADPRFGMLETVRDFALEQLAATGEADEARRRHAAWFVAFGVRAEPHLLRGPDQPGWLERLSVEQANLRLALDWLVERSEADALRLASALRYFWYLRGPLSEGQAWLARSLAAETGALPALRVLALADLSLLTIFQGDPDRATRTVEDAARLAETVEDRLALASLRQAQGYLALLQGETGRGLALANESVALFEGLDHRGRQNSARLTASLAAFSHGDLSEAQSLAEQNLAHGRQIGDDAAVGTSLNHLGWVTIQQGNHRAAARWFAEALTSIPRLGESWNGAYHVPSFEGLASAASATGAHELAARFLGASATVLGSTGFRLPPILETHHQRTVAAAQAALGADAFRAAWAAGATLSPDELVAAATALAEDAGPGASPARTPGAHPSGLTDRELEVLRLVAAGLTAPQIAEQLFLSPRTVHAHTAAIYRKLDVNTRGEAVRYAVEHGLT
jgi:predicted ATPase/DNA-binding CsgD family transcriptional regulator